MGIKERKEREKENMRGRVLEAALELFTTEGYESVTLRRIGERIEYSPATIYLYFKDKDDIFFALLRQGFDALYARQCGVQTVADPRERLLAHGRVYVDFALEQPKLYEIMFVMHGPLLAMQRDQDFASAGQSYEILRRNVAECQAAGHFTGENVEVVAFTLWSLVHGISSLAIGGRLQGMPDHILAMLVDGAKDIMGRVIAVDRPSSAMPQPETKPRSRKTADDTTRHPAKRKRDI